MRAVSRTGRFGCNRTKLDRITCYWQDYAFFLARRLVPLPLRVEVPFAFFAVFTFFFDGLDLAFADNFCGANFFLAFFVRRDEFFPRPAALDFPRLIFARIVSTAVLIGSLPSAEDWPIRAPATPPATAPTGPPTIPPRTAPVRLRRFVSTRMVGLMKPDVFSTYGFLRFQLWPSTDCAYHIARISSDALGNLTDHCTISAPR
jgi:hypothetical protein